MNSERVHAFTRNYGSRILIPALAALAFYLAYTAGLLLEEGRPLASVGLIFGAAVVWQIALYFLQKVTGKKVSLFT